MEVKISLADSIISTKESTTTEIKRWYKTRKPRLQLDILACRGLRGELSKGEVESLLKDRGHANIINSFKKLEKHNWVKKSGHNP